MNAILHAWESETQLRTEIDRTQVDRILLKEGEIMYNGLLAVTSLGNVLPKVSSPKARIRTDNNNFILIKFWACLSKLTHSPFQTTPQILIYQITPLHQTRLPLPPPYLPKIGSIIK